MSENTFTLPSYAKINWFLRVLGKREDGYHELCTVFQTVSLHDSLRFSDASEISLTCTAPHLPTDEKNLIVRAANALRKRFAVKKGARIHLEKRIPAPGGLGGGSSNAAVALVGLARLWKIKTGLDELTEIGGELGADVPFFFHGGTAVGTGRGTVIIPRPEIIEGHMLIVTPDRDVPTAAAFALLRSPHLTNNDSKSILQICRYEAMALNLRQSDPVNDFEKAVFRAEPEIERVKHKLLGSGARHAAMSGSGASVFAVFDSKEKLQSAFDELQTEPAWRRFIVSTVSRREYLRSLNLA